MIDRSRPSARAAPATPSTADTLMLKLQAARLLAVELCTEHVPEMVQTLVTLARTAERESVQQGAATTIIKIATAKEFEVELKDNGKVDPQPVKIFMVDRNEASTELEKRLAAERVSNG